MMRRDALLRLATAALLAVGGLPVAVNAGGIGGSVVAAENGSPLSCEVSVLTAGGEWLASALCDIAGSYEVTGLADGAYMVRAEVPSEPDRVAHLWPDTVFWDEATPVEVEGDLLTGDVDFTLPLGGRISGTLRQGQTGEPLPDVGIAVYSPPGWRWSQISSSDDDGAYAVAGIPPGSYVVQAFDAAGPHVVQYWDHAATERGATLLAIERTERLTGIDFDLLLEASIAGHVRLSGSGIPVGGARIEANDVGELFQGVATSTVDGAFRIGKLHRATYRVSAAAEGLGVAFALGPDGQPAELSVDEGEALTGVTILLEPGGAIAGTVTRASDGAALGGVYVSAWRIGEAAGAGIDTGDDGRYRIDGLPAGLYRVIADPPADLNLVPQEYPDPVEVAVGQEITGIDLVLDSGGQITGQVTALGDGRPLEDVYVAASEVDGWVTRSATTDSQGRFRLAGLATSAHLVVALHPDFAAQTYDRSLLPDAGSPVSVVAGETTADVAFVLEHAGKISGAVRSAATGEPLADVLVTAALYDGVLIPGAWTETAGDGTYVLDSVPAGAVYVLAADSAGRYSWQWYPSSAVFAGALTLTVVAGATVPEVDLWLEQPGAVSLSATELAFAGAPYQDDIPHQILTISNAGPGPAALDLWSSADYLCVDADLRATVILPGDRLDVEVSAWPAGLAPGSYTATLHAVDLRTGADHPVAVTLRVGEAPPRIETTPETLFFDAEVGAGAPSPQVVSLTNLGSAVASFTAAADAPWLRVTPSAGTVHRGHGATGLEVAVDPSGLEPSAISASLTVSSEADDSAVAVHLELAPAAGGEPLIIAPEQVSLLLPPDQAPGADPSTTVAISNGGTGILFWNARTQAPWLSLQPPRGALAAGAPATAIVLSVDPSELDPGAHSAVVTVASSRQTHQVELVVQVSSVVELGSLAASASARLVVPVLAHAAGQHGSQFVSDLWLARRPSSQDDQVTLAFVPEGQDGTLLAVVTRLELGPGETVALLDMVEAWLGGAYTKGSLIIISDRIDEYEVATRTYNSAGKKQDVTPTYGQVVPGLSTHNAVGRLEGRLYVPGLERSQRFRSNLLITEVSGQAATARVELTASDGTALGATEVELLPFATTQLNDVFAALGHVGDAAAALGAVEVTTGAGRIVALGSVVDNATNDPTTILGRAKSTDPFLVVPVVARGEGIAGTRWASDVTVANADSSPRHVLIVFRDSDGTRIGTTAATIEGGHTLRLADVVGSFTDDPSRGSLSLETVPSGGLVISSRTYNTGGGGTFGQGVDPVTRDQAITAGGHTLRLIALHNTGRYRTNLGITEIQGASVRVAVTVHDAIGAQILGYRELDLPAWGQLQLNLFAAIGRSDAIYAATATLQVVSGGGAVTAYASMVDNTTGDATTLPPPQRVEPGQITTPPSPSP